MLPLSEILSISNSVDESWRSPVADAVSACWGVPAGTARWLRSSATHVFVVPGGASAAPSGTGAGPTFLRFTPAASLAGDKLSESGRILSAWADRGLGAVRPVPLPDGSLTAYIETSVGDIVAMMVAAAPGEEVAVDDLTLGQARSWGEALGRLHAEGSEGTKPEPLRESFPASSGRLGRAIRTIDEELASVDPRRRSRGLCHGDFELDNLRFKGTHVTFFDTDEAHYGWFATDVALAVRDLTGSTLGSQTRPDLLEAFLAGYRRHQPFTEEEEENLPLHSLAASVRILRQLDGVIDTDNDPDHPEWFTELRGSLIMHQDWHRQRLLNSSSSVVGPGA